MDNNKRFANSFFHGLFWNYGSIVVLAVGGLIFNGMIVLFYDSVVLGYFNQIYAIYIIISQIAVFGIHASVLRYLSDDQQNKKETILASALLDVVIISVIVMAVGIVAVSLISKDPSFKNGMLGVLPSLVFFSVNKVLLNALNAMNKMKMFGIFQSMRVIGIIIGIILIHWLDIHSSFLSASLTFSEFILMIFLLGHFMKEKMLQMDISFDWCKKHLFFGLKSIPSYVVLELNSKADIVCLSLLMSDKSLIGVYSFVAMFAEGFYQLFVVVRRSLNPHLVVMHASQEINKMIVNRRNRGLLFLFAIAVQVLLFFVVLGLTTVAGQEYREGILPFLVVTTGITLNCKYIVLGNTMSQIGKPEIDSFMNVITVTANIVMNLWLIQHLGILGAAVATAISYFIFGVLLKSSIKKHFPLLLV